MPPVTRSEETPLLHVEAHGRGFDNVAVESLGGQAPPGTAAEAGVTVIVPTRYEAGNMAEFLRRLLPALDGRPAEVVFVDDSDDETPQEVEHASGHSPRVTIRIIHRARRQRPNGLGGAVLEGLRRASYDWCVVMAADLQHPPELVPRLISTGMDCNLELVVASRDMKESERLSLAGNARMAVSEWTTRLTRAAFPRGLRDITDPLSGFFAVRRSALDVESLRPNGLEILFEVATRGRPLRAAEIPFQSAQRHAGQTKESRREGLRFARLVVRLWLTARMRTRAGRMLGFAMVGATGIAVNSAALVAGMGLGLHYLWAAVAATEVSTTWNWMLLELTVFTSTKRASHVRRYLGFSAVNHVALLLRIPLLAVLFGVVGIPIVISNVVTLLAVFTMRFTVSDTLIFGSRRIP